MSNIYGILLIGCGHIGEEHLQDIYCRDNIRVIGTVDTDICRAAAFARRFGAADYGTDYRPFLQRADVDIVIIATYTETHLPILQDCLAANKHVLCEKPITGNLKDGQTFVEAVKAAKTKVLVAHILRHNASYLTIRDLIRNGAIGELRLTRMTQNHHALDWPRYLRLLEDCSPTVDCGVHYYDLIQWITGAKIVEVTGMGTRTQNDVPRDNHTMVTFRLDNGCSGFYEVGWGESIRSCNIKEFIGTTGRITLKMKMGREDDFEEGDLITVYHSDTHTYESINLRVPYKDMNAQMQTLIRMIETGEDGNPTIDEVWQSFRVAIAAAESVETGKTVHL